MKLITRMLVITASAFMIEFAFAHGVPQPQHGGIMDDAGLVAVEMVSKDGAVNLYVTDDDTPVDASHITGVLTVLNAGGAKKEAPLSAVGGNQLQAKGVKVEAGARVTALLTMADGATKVSARFKIQ